MNMSEKRFVLCKKGDVEYIEDNGCVQLYGFDVLCEMLNEQQATISALHEENTSFKESQDGKRRAILWWEHYKEKWANAEKELRKLKEENGQLRTLLKERQYEKDIAKCREENEQLRQEREYWKNKAMTLLMQVRRLTPRMTDKEVKEFSKELEE